MFTPHQTPSRRSTAAHRGSTLLLVVTMMLSIALVSAVPVHTAHADEPAALDQFVSQRLSLTFQLFGGLRLKRGDRVVEPGFFGGDAETIFDGSDKALDAMETYRTLRITGTALWATGLAVLVTELVMIIADPELFFDPSDDLPNGLYWGMLGGGVVVGAVGGIMVQSANSYLSDAVEYYNADLYERLRQSAPRSSMVFRYRTSF